MRSAVYQKVAVLYVTTMSHNVTLCVDFALIYSLSRGVSYFICLFIHSFKWDWDLNTFGLAKQGLYYLNHTFSPFCSGYFGDGVSQVGLES
jgi:hypothetical protein